MPEGTYEITAVITDNESEPVVVIHDDVIIVEPPKVWLREEFEDVQLRVLGDPLVVDLPPLFDNPL